MSNNDKQESNKEKQDRINNTVSEIVKTGLFKSFSLVQTVQSSNKSGNKILDRFVTLKNDKRHNSTHIVSIKVVKTVAVQINLNSSLNWANGCMLTIFERFETVEKNYYDLFRTLSKNQELANLLNQFLSNQPELLAFYNECKTEFNNSLNPLNK